MIKLRVAHIDLAVFTFLTEIMRATTVTFAVPATSAVAAVTEAIALVNVMTLLAAPVALIQQFIWISSPQGTNGLSHDLNLVFGEGGSGG